MLRLRPRLRLRLRLRMGLGRWLVKGRLLGLVRPKTTSFLGERRKRGWNVIWLVGNICSRRSGAPCLIKLIEFPFLAMKLPSRGGIIIAPNSSFARLRKGTSIIVP